MNKIRMVVIMLVALTAVLTYAESSLAVDSGKSSESLRGLKGVAVTIEVADEKGLKGGVTLHSMRTEVEEKLALAGIQILSEEELIKEPGQPSLYVTVNFLKVGSLTLTDVYLGLHQGVLLIRNMNNPVMVNTWSVSALVTDSALVRDALRNSTDKFIEAYFSMNPKQ
ncbi:MAG: hypothetical protein C4576_23215 [Desulfobacteraceae bacterium]|nr:MAG: hypothetical protein C4576_23215 [Desulfobacteraceae bacterium]